jgi:hypothetical protein
MVFGAEMSSDELVDGHVTLGALNIWLGVHAVVPRRRRRRLAPLLAGPLRVGAAFGGVDVPTTVCANRTAEARVSQLISQTVAKASKLFAFPPVKAQSRSYRSVLIWGYLWGYFRGTFF